jgi:hypothetical protein
MTKTISKKPNTQPSTPSAGRDAIMRGYRKGRRRLPKVLDAEIYFYIEKSLRNVELDVRFGRFDGRPDLVKEAFMELEDLNHRAYDAFIELQRDTREGAWNQCNNCGRSYGSTMQKSSRAVVPAGKILFIF